MTKSKNLKYFFLMTTLVCSISGVALAQKKNFNDLVLAVGSNETGGIVTGNTGGAYSLASITNSDRDGNPCLGYGDPQPDHIITLKGNFAQLTLQIDSGGSDTTLIVKDVTTNSIRCGLGQNESQDAVIQDSNWSAGTYHIWVGSMSPNQRSPYRLSVQP
ncbi:hypothetical protein [Hyella patelloides]|nr:hypothetical protein [Hyella patelloides]